MVDVYGIFSRVDIHHFPWECYGEIGSKTMDASWEMLQKKNWASFQIEKDLDSLGKFGILPRDNGWQKKWFE